MDTEAVIVGAGPVGLLLAAELCLAGVRPIVLERLSAPSEQPKARGIGVLAAEALRRRGLGPELEREHAKGLAALERDHGTTKTHFAWIHKIDPGAADPGRDGALIGQPALEGLLRRHLSDLGVEVHFGFAMVGHDDDGDSVTLQLDSPTGPRQITAGYVVGCDGGHSSVRKLAGFGFPGTPPLMTIRYAQADVRGRDRLPPPGRLPEGTLFHDEGMIATFDFTDTAYDRSAPLSADEIRDSVRRVAGVDIAIDAFHGGLRFTDQARQADTYQLGHTLLAGDAAHVHSPNGGQGLNLGLMDAMNLGWKLAATIRGTAPETLLASYTAERHPVGAAVLHNTRAQSALLAPGGHVDALRDIMGDLMDLPEVNRHLARALSGITHRYAMPGGSAHPLVGIHCPPFTADGVPVEQFTADAQPLLLHPTASDPRVKTVAAAGLSDERLAAVLLRPDGVIAWAAAPGEDWEPAALGQAMDAWFVGSFTDDVPPARSVIPGRGGPPGC